MCLFILTLVSWFSLLDLILMYIAVLYIFYITITYIYFF